MNISKKGLTIALLASAAINLIVLGAVGGIAMAGRHHQSPPAKIQRTGPPAQFRFDPRTFIRALPETERRKAMASLKAAAGKHQEIHRASMLTKEDLARLLSAKQLDEAKIEAVLARVRDLDAQSQKLAQAIVLDILRDLDPETRRRVIQTASRIPKYRKKRTQGRKPQRRPQQP